MPRQYPDQVSFYDAATDFSKEEWKLLQEWQKELYSNVMNEIRQALVSLGPVIATTVLSLLSKEKDHLISLNNTDSERRNHAHHSTSDVINNPDVFPSLKEAENQYLKNIPGNERSDSYACHDTGIQLVDTDCMVKVEEPISFPIDHLGEEVQESNCDSHLGHEVISIRIKDEEESWYVEHQETKRRDAINHFTGSGSNNQKTNTSSYTEFNDKSPIRTPATKMTRGNVTPNIYGRKSSANQVCPASYQELTVEEASIPYESTLRDDNVFQFQSHPPKNRHSGYQRTHKEKGKYTCNVCGKIFAKMSKIIAHERIHTGERPFHCTVCGKSFNQKGILYRHFQRHTGEKPFQCNECGKRFNRNYQLLGHQKIHTQTPQD